MPHKPKKKLIAQWKRSKTEQLRIVLDVLYGRNVVSLRTWWRDDDGNDYPGRDGITFDIKHIPKLARAFKRAWTDAKKAGLLKNAE